LTITTEQPDGTFMGTFYYSGWSPNYTTEVTFQVSGTLSPYNLLNGDRSTITFQSTDPVLGGAGTTLSFTGTVSPTGQIGGTAQLDFYWHVYPSGQPEHVTGWRQLSGTL
jgi:hypothetical protein